MIKRIRAWLITRRVEKAISALRYLDDIMIVKGYTRQYRRALWRDVVASIDTREELRGYLKDWIKEIA